MLFIIKRTDLITFNRNNTLIRNTRCSLVVIEHEQRKAPNYIIKHRTIYITLTTTEQQNHQTTLTITELQHQGTTLTYQTTKPPNIKLYRTILTTTELQNHRTTLTTTELQSHQTTLNHYRTTNPLKCKTTELH